MYRDRLLIASPLIATLVFGSIGTSHASVTPTPASAGDSHVVTTSNSAPPVCKSLPKGQKKICKNGYSDGFAAEKKCGPPRMTGQITDDEAYDIGYNAGYNSGRRNCPS
ncbi:hypothetical protein [Nonomuraea sp. NPDC001831]|uniref:hypothetical protein n=1 Tax=Nonomuraea sp. NPDC001831 TaxID=3364340 RepID=UPI0036971A1F